MLQTSSHVCLAMKSAARPYCACKLCFDTQSAGSGHCTSAHTSHRDNQLLQLLWICVAGFVRLCVETFCSVQAFVTANSVFVNHAGPGADRAWQD